eukprot:189616-Pyramimonas_sp.AAC.1
MQGSTVRALNGERRRKRGGGRRRGRNLVNAERAGQPRLSARRPLWQEQFVRPPGPAGPGRPRSEGGAWRRCARPQG